MNKGYIKVVLFLLSLFAYVTNKALASEQFSWEYPTNIFTSRTDATRYAYSNFAIPSNWRVKSISRLNKEILRNVSSNEVGRKDTRPKVPIQSNNNSNFTFPSNCHLKTNHNLNVAIGSNDNSNSALPSNWRIKPNRPLNAAVIKKFSSIGVSPKDTRPNVPIQSNDNSNVAVENIFPRM